MTPRPSLGLRARLLFAFALLCVVTAAAVAGGSYVQARNAILQRTQDAAVQAMNSRLEAIYPLRSAAPGREELDEIAASAAGQDSLAVAVHGETHSSLPPLSPPPPPSGPEPGLQRPGGKVRLFDVGVISPGLRQVVAGGLTAWQRVVWQGNPYLVIGMPLLIIERDRTTRVSGIEVYTARSLLSEQRSIDELAARAWLIGGAALVFAVLLASLATRGVLGPVRELGRAARLLGEGELRTRVEVRGSDELADVARTFNDAAAELERLVGQLREMEADARRFVADVSHELRTPLAALAAVADVLEEEAAGLPDPAGRAARLVSQETLNLTALVNDLIEISRFDSGVPRGRAGGDPRGRAGGDLGCAEDDDHPVGGVDGQFHLRVEHAQQPLEVAAARRRQEGPDHLALLPNDGGRPLGRPHLPARAAGEHLGGVGGPAEDPADLVERHREQVVEHERQPLARPERLQDDQERQADRVGERHVVLRRGAVVGQHDEFGRAVVVGRLGAGPA